MRTMAHATPLRLETEAVLWEFRYHLHQGHILTRVPIYTFTQRFPTAIHLAPDLRSIGFAHLHDLRIVILEPLWNVTLQVLQAVTTTGAWHPHQLDGVSPDFRGRSAAHAEVREAMTLPQKL